jgi:hypothetical protein
MSNPWKVPPNIRNSIRIVHIYIHSTNISPGKFRRGFRNISFHGSCTRQPFSFVCTYLCTCNISKGDPLLCYSSFHEHDTIAWAALQSGGPTPALSPNPILSASSSTLCCTFIDSSTRSDGTQTPPQLLEKSHPFDAAKKLLRVPLAYICRLDKPTIASV